MAQMKTSDVYIGGENDFPNSVVEAATAIPAFIGITEKAQNGPDSLSGKPWKITSMTEFRQYFGGAPSPKFVLSVDDARKDVDPAPFYSLLSADGSKAMTVTDQSGPFSLYYQMVMFYANGGDACYIVSVGTYEEGAPVDKDKVASALAAMEKEQEITMVLVPEAASAPDCKDIQTRVLEHCGKMKNRIAILDVQKKASEKEKMSDRIETFRTNVGDNFLSYGAAYYPWLNTSVLSDKDIDGSVLTWDFTLPAPDLAPFFALGSRFPKYFADTYAKIAAGDEVEKNNLHNALLQNLLGYQYVVNAVKYSLNLLPPSAAMAGLYTMVDSTRGVWKAPANVSVNCVDNPSENIDDAMQEDLNMPMNGKAVNAIRSFPGEGTKVWGARTLDGNSQDWRYVNVRRTMMFLDGSVKNAAKAYVLEPNVAATWTNVRSRIDNFLRSIWKRGGLAGAAPEDAYEIHVGLGDTMTATDILDGIMRVTVLVAITRPAEFLEITFQQQMQKS